MTKCKICGEKIKGIKSNSIENYCFNCYLYWSKNNDTLKTLSYTGKKEVIKNG